MSLNLKTGVTWSNLYHPFIDSFGAKNAGQGNEHKSIIGHLVCRLLVS